MSIITEAPFQAMTDYLNSISAGATMSFYDGGNMRPSIPEHALHRGYVEIAKFNLLAPTFTLDYDNTRLLVNVGEQILFYENYSFPTFGRINLTGGDCIYQFNCLARGLAAPTNPVSTVELCNRMPTDRLTDTTSNAYQEVPPNYTFTLDNFYINLRGSTLFLNN